MAGTCSKESQVEVLFQLSGIVGGFVGAFPDFGGIPLLAERLPLQGIYCRKRRTVRDVRACALVHSIQTRV